MKTEATSSFSAVVVIVIGIINVSKTKTSLIPSKWNVIARVNKMGGNSSILPSNVPSNGRQREIVYPR